MERFQVHINSKYGIQIENDSSNLLFQEGQDIVNSANGQVVRCWLESATIPHGWYNFTEKNRNVKVHIEGHGTEEFQFPLAQLTAADVKSILNQWFSGGPANWAVFKFDSTRSKFLLDDLNSDLEFRDIEHNAYYELGFKPIIGKTINSKPDLNDHVNACDLSGTKKLFISLQGLSASAKPSYNGFDNTPLLACIPVSSEFTEVEIYVPPNPFVVEQQSFQLGCFTIQLLDEDGDYVKMNGNDWSCSITFEIEDRPMEGFLTNANPYDAPISNYVTDINSVDRLRRNFDEQN